MAFAYKGSNNMRRTKAIIGTAISLVTLAVGLAVIDPRVRDEFTRLLHGGTPGELTGAGATLRDVATTTLVAVRDQGVEHAPLALFGIGAMVLVLFMTKT
jgi:hypothetical protein